MTTEQTMPEPDYYGHRQRLRERFLKGGGRDLPDYELLELILMMALPRKDVKPLAKELLRRFDGYAGVLNASVAELTEVNGIKENTAIALKVVKESAVRFSWHKLSETDEAVITNWDAMLDYCRTAMANNPVEEFRIIFLNVKLKVIGEEIQQRGTINQVSIHPREVIKAAMMKGAGAIIMVHNHPSGDITPSKADIDITNKINEGLKAVNIRLFDHLIVSKYDIYSFRDHGVIME